MGIVTPVAVIKTVELSGAKISNITLHNAEHVKAYNRPGDEIEIVRSGEVIPKFLRVLTKPVVILFGRRPVALAMHRLEF